jgi:hypothetical protein
MLIRFNERVKFTICHAIEHPAVRTDVSDRPRQLDLHPGIAVRRDHVGLDFAFWAPGAKLDASRVKFSTTV